MDIETIFNKDFKSKADIVEAFPDEISCESHLQNLRWPDGDVRSPFTGKTVSWYDYCTREKIKRYICHTTSKVFNVKTNTLFEAVDIPLQKWFIAIWLFTNSKEITYLELADELLISKETAEEVLNNLRECFKDVGICDRGDFENPYVLCGEYPLPHLYEIHENHYNIMMLETESFVLHVDKSLKQKIESIYERKNEPLLEHHYRFVHRMYIQKCDSFREIKKDCYTIHPLLFVSKIKFRDQEQYLLKYAILK